MATTTQNIARDKFVVNIKNFSFFAFFEKLGVIKAAPNQPADKFTIKSDKTKETILSNIFKDYNKKLKE